MRLEKGLPLGRVVHAIHFHARAEDVHRYACGFYLHDLHVRRDQKRIGHASAVEFAEKNVGMPRKKAGEAIRIEAALEELPRIRKAFASGEVSWSKVRAIVRVATEATEEAWLEAARSKTSNELERMVKGKEKGQKPSDDLGTRRTTCRIQYDVPASVKATWDTAIEKILKEMGDGATPLDALKVIAERALVSSEGKESPYTVVFHVAPDGQSAWADFDDGRVPIGIDEAFQAARSGRVLELPDPLEGEYPAIPFGERGKVPPGERDDPTSPALRQAVLTRDGHRCLLCGSKENLGVHHFHARANGGKTVIERLGTFCGSHHAVAHEGFVDLFIDSTGKVHARDPSGRDIGIAVPAAEALKDAGAEHPLTLVEVVPATVVETFSACAKNGNDSQESSGASQVVTISHSPLEDDALRAVRLAESLDELPPVIGPAAWHALSGRLEWVRSEGGLVFHPEWEGAPPRAQRRENELEHRAPRLSDLIGQERVTRNLEIAVRAARRRGEPLPHILLQGPPGVGKTTISRALAREMEAGIHVIEGGAVEDPKKVAALLTGLGKGDILFIDEIHALPAPVAECFYPALEEGVFHTQVRSRASSRLLEVTLAPFTLIGATTEEGKLPAPFRSRFRLQQSLELYALDALETIASRAAKRLGVPATEEASRGLACRARGTPRVALNLVAWARDHAQDAGLTFIESESVERAMEALGIDGDGLDRDDRRILRLLIERHRPMGIATIAATLRMDPRTIGRVHEPYLLERGYLVRTSRGREATEKARRLLAELAT